MTIFGRRLELLLATPPEPLHIRPRQDDGPLYRGRYFVWRDEPYALGKEVGRGEEAIVHEMINLRSGSCRHVIKLCRHAPGTDQYMRWALPVRFQVNPGAAIPNLELMPSELIAVPGGLVKVQPYLSLQPGEAWQSDLPTIGISRLLSQASPQGRQAILAKLTAQHGDQPALLSLKSELAEEADDLDAALALLRPAVASYLAHDHPARYVAALRLAILLTRVYERDRSHGDAEFAFNLNGLVLRQTIFSDLGPGARDDSMQDHALFVLMETMADLPYFVAGLVFLCHDLGNLTHIARALIAAIQAVDPQSPEVEHLTEQYIPAHSPRSEPSIDVAATEELLGARRPAASRQSHAQPPDALVSGLAALNGPINPSSPICAIRAGALMRRAFTFPAERSAQRRPPCAKHSLSTRRKWSCMSLWLDSLMLPIAR